MKRIWRGLTNISDIEFAMLSSIAHLRKGELPRWGKGRGKPLPRKAGKEGLEDCMLGQILGRKHIEHIWLNLKHLVKHPGKPGHK